MKTLTWTGSGWRHETGDSEHSGECLTPEQLDTLAEISRDNDKPYATCASCGSHEIHQGGCADCGSPYYMLGAGPGKDKR